jgi:hypothetical protein
VKGVPQGSKSPASRSFPLLQPNSIVTALFCKRLICADFTYCSPDPWPKYLLSVNIKEEIQEDIIISESRKNFLVHWRTTYNSIPSFNSDISWLF